MPWQLEIHKSRRPATEQHNPKRPDTRESACARGYDRQWRRYRRWYIQHHPICERCNNAPATVADHITPLRAGGAHMSDANTQALCRPCHRVKTDEDMRQFPEVYGDA